ncbi:amidohydrolase family protein [Xenophilus arseniciresistens]|uniref:Amidohydrolase family protein n=1 Tax=Xenophilus arseniciresistens TaxID=1283306 RepID=A0AAE3NAE2_9BURK|nr:amidohydrolase family protein [Xenophilus arseniciresistens]MDA7418690.1 amidohydrolase family protein [Xenophilus arseniciresistens]
MSAADHTHSGPAGSLLIRGARVLSLDKRDREWPCADILVSGGRIQAIGPNLQAPAEAQCLDAHGMLAMPGLINAHFHSPGNFMRGQLDGLPLELFMLYEVPPLAQSGDSQRMAYLRTMMGALEMLERGITAVHDDAYHVPLATPQGIDAVMQAYADAGIRATVAIDQPNVVEYDKFPYLRELLPADVRAEMEAAPLQGMDELLTLYSHLIDRWHGCARGRLSAAVSCSAPQRVTRPYLQALSELSRSHDLPYNLHVLETKLQRATGLERFGQSLLRYIHEAGVLDERCEIIHAVWIDDDDLRLLADSGAVVAHNPVCNLRLGSGVMPWRALHDAGVPIAIGTDELCTDDTANLWVAGKMAGLIHNLSHADPAHWPRHAEVLRALTAGGARALRREGELGQLAPGALADIVLLDLDRWSFTPCNDLRRQLVYSEDGSSVRHVVVNGELVVRDGAHVSIDVAAIREEIRTLTPVMHSQWASSHAAASRLWPYYQRMLAQAHALPSGLTRRVIAAD